MCVEIIKESVPDDNSFHFKLGRAYKSIGDIPIAIALLESYLSKSQAMGDKTKSGKAQMELASCYEMYYSI